MENLIGSNIMLIGMPGAGKSTVGVILAKYLSYDFIDTDVAIQTYERRLLQDILDNDGYMELRRIEEKILLSLKLTSYVIATGGSAVYSENAMIYLKKNCISVFLNLDFETIKKRINNFDTRGIARRPDQSFAELFKERYELYVKYADITIDCTNLNQEQVSFGICKELGINSFP